MATAPRDRGQGPSHHRHLTYPTCPPVESIKSMDPFIVLAVQRWCHSLATNERLGVSRLECLPACLPSTDGWMRACQFIVDRWSSVVWTGQHTLHDMKQAINVSA